MATGSGKELLCLRMTKTFHCETDKRKKRLSLDSKKNPRHEPLGRNRNADLANSRERHECHRFYQKGT